MIDFSCLAYGEKTISKNILRLVRFEHFKKFYEVREKGREELKTSVKAMNKINPLNKGRRGAKRRVRKEGG